MQKQKCKTKSVKYDSNAFFRTVDENYACNDELCQKLFQDN